MTTPEAGYVRRVRRAESDIIAVYEQLEGIQRTVDQQTITLAHHSVLLNGQSVRLDRVETRMEGMEHRLHGVEVRLDEHGDLLKEILRRLPAAP